MVVLSVVFFIVLRKGHFMIHIEVLLTFKLLMTQFCNEGSEIQCCTL